MDSLDTLCNVLKCIYKRPGMFFEHYHNFESYTSFVGGFLYGMSLIHYIPYGYSVSKAFVGKYNQGQGANAPLTYIIDNLYENESDEVKIEIYMSFLIEYYEKYDCAL